MTPELEHLVAAGIRQDVAERWLEPVQIALARFGITSERQVAAWIAQTAHESGGYRMLEENLNYRAVTLAACWPNRFAELDGNKKPKRDSKGALIPTKVALAIERKPELIANMVYSNRMANGPAESGDGWRYRGRGLKQLTGRDNYTRCSQALGLDLVNQPDLLLEPGPAALSAAWFWMNSKCGPLADAGDQEALCRRINGGLIGLADRKARYEKVMQAMGIAAEMPAAA